MSQSKSYLPLSISEMSDEALNFSVSVFSSVKCYEDPVS